MIMTGSSDVIGWLNWCNCPSDNP